VFFKVEMKNMAYPKQHLFGLFVLTFIYNVQQMTASRKSSFDSCGKSLVNRSCWFKAFEVYVQFSTIT